MSKRILRNFVPFSPLCVQYCVMYATHTFYIKSKIFKAADRCRQVLEFGENARLVVKCLHFHFLAPSYINKWTVFFNFNHKIEETHYNIKKTIKTISLVKKPSACGITNRLTSSVFPPTGAAYVDIRAVTLRVNHKKSKNAVKKTLTNGIL